MAKQIIVGKLSVKVTPDTKGFRRDLERELRQIDDGKELGNGMDRARDRTVRATDTIVRSLREITRGVEDMNKPLSEFERHIESTDTLKKNLKVFEDVDTTGIRDMGEHIRDLEREMGELEEASRRMRELNFAPGDESMNAWDKMAKDFDKSGKSMGETTDALSDKWYDLADDLRKSRKSLADSIKAIGDNSGSIERFTDRLNDMGDAIKKGGAADLEKMVDHIRRLGSEMDLMDQHADGFKDINKAWGDLNKEFENTLHNRVLPDLEKELGNLGKGVNKLDRQGLDNLLGDLDKMDEKLRQASNYSVKPHLFRPLVESVLLARHEVEQLKDKLEEMDGKNYKPEVNPVLGTILDISARLAKLTRDRFVEIFVKLNQAAYKKVQAQLAALAGGRVFKNLVQDLNDFFASLDENLPKLATLATGIGGLGIGIVALTSNIFGLVDSLGRIGPAALLLPGLLTGIGIGVASTVMAFYDMNKVMPDVIERFKNLQSIVSDNFWEVAAGPIRELANVLLPVLEKGFGNVGTALGEFFAFFSTSLQGTFLELLPEMFDDLAESIRVASAYTDQFANIIAILGKHGADWLPRLALWFGEISRSFSDWLTEADKTGKLDMFIKDAVFQMKELWRVLQNTYGIIKDISAAAEAAGGASLTRLADGLRDIRDVTESEGFQKGLTNFLRSAHDGMDALWKETGPALSNFLKEFGALSTTLLPTIGAAFGNLASAILDGIGSPDFMRGLRDFFEGVRDGFGKAGGGITNFIEGLGHLMQEFKPVIENIGEIFGTVLDTVGEALKILAPGLAAFAKELTGGLLDGLKAMAPGFEDLMGALSEMLKGGGGKKIGDALRSLGEGIGRIASSIATAMTEMSEEDKKRLLSLLDELPDLILNVTNTVANINWGALLSFAAFLAEFVGNVLGAVNDLFGDEAGAPRDRAWWEKALDGLSDWIVALPLNLVQAIGQITASLGTLITGISTGLGIMFRSLGADTIAGFIEGQGQKVGEALTAVGDFINRFIQKIKDLLGIHSPSTVLAQIGRDTVQGFINGVGELIGKAVDKGKELVDRFIAAIKDIGTKAKEKFSEVASNAKTKLGEAVANAKTRGSELITAMKDKFKAARDEALRKWDGIGTSVYNKLAPIVSQARSKASEMLTALRDKFRDARSEALRKWDGIGSSVYSKLGPIVSNARNKVGEMKSAMSTKAVEARDAVLAKVRDLTYRLPGISLYSAGSSIMSSLYRGLQSYYSTIQSYLQNLTNMIPSWKGPEERDKNLLTPAGQLIMQSLLDGFEDGYEDVKKFLGVVTEDIAKTDFTATATVAQKNSRKVTAALAEQVTAGGVAPGGAGPTLQVTNYYPQAEPTSVTTNRAMQTAAAFGLMG